MNKKFGHGKGTLNAKTYWRQVGDIINDNFIEEDFYMDEKMIQEIKATVDSFFSEKEEAEVRRKTEEALQKSAETISELTVALEEKNSKSEEVATKVKELEEEIAELKSGLEAAQTEKASTEEKLTKATTTIEEMKKDQATELRLADLEKAGVASGKEAQTAKIREMSDEEFAAYKEERIELRNAVIAELDSSDDGSSTAEEEAAAKLASEEEEAAAAEAAAAEAVAAAASASAEEGVKTIPAKVDQTQSISAALNFETVPSKDVTKRYEEMGQAMADLMTGKKDK